MKTRIFFGAKAWTSFFIIIAIIIVILLFFFGLALILIPLILVIWVIGRILRMFRKRKKKDYIDAKFGIK